MCTDTFAMLERYRFVSADEDVDDLMEETISFAHETAEYGYEDEDEDDLESPVGLKPAIMAVPPPPSAPPPPAPDMPIAYEKAAAEEIPVIAAPKKHAAKVKAIIAKKSAPPLKAIAAKQSAPVKKTVAKKTVAKRVAAKKIAAKKTQLLAIPACARLIPFTS